MSYVSTWRIIAWAVGLHLTLSSAAAYAEEPTVEYLVARDAAYRAELPRRFRVAEDFINPTGELFRRVDVRWDDRVEYSEKFFRRGSAATEEPASLRWCTFDGSQWYEVVQRASESQWIATIAARHPHYMSNWFLANFWQRPDGNYSLAEMLQRGGVFASASQDDDVRICVGASPSVLRAIDERVMPVLFVGWIVTLSRQRDWRPTLIRSVVHTGNGRAELVAKEVPTDIFAEQPVLVDFDTRLSEWKNIAGSWVPLRVERTQYAREDAGRLVAERREFRLVGEAEPLISLPPGVTFGARPPEQFARRGLVVDQLRNRTEQVDYRTGAEREADTAREVRELSNKVEPYEGRASSRWLYLCGAVVLAGALGAVLWRWRRRVG